MQGERDVSTQEGRFSHTPLPIAAIGRYIELGKILIKAGGRDLDLKECSQQTPFGMASLFDYREIIKQLANAKNRRRSG